jgi:hypothetical protein
MKKIIIFLLATILLSRSTELYVEESGNDENLCKSVRGACKTLNVAIQKSQENGKIYISTLEDESVKGFTKSLSIISTNKNKTKLTNRNNFYIHKTEGIEIYFENLIFKNIFILSRGKF